MKYLYVLEKYKKWGFIDYVLNEVHEIDQFAEIYLVKYELDRYMN